MKTKISNFNGYLRYANDELFLEEVSCKSLAEKIRTPFYCYSLSEIEDNFYKLKNSFSKINPLICYAVKANHNALVINYSKLDKKKALDVLKEVKSNSIIKQLPTYTVFTYLNI